MNDFSGGSVRSSRLRRSASNLNAAKTSQRTESRRRARRRALNSIRGNREQLTTVLHRMSDRIFQLRQAIQVQQARISDGTFEQAQTDMDLVVPALRELRQYGAVLAELGVDVGGSLRQFDAEFPEAKDVRDVFSHPEDYLLGLGNLQTDSGANLDWSYARGNTAGTAIHMRSPDRSFDIGRAMGTAVSMGEGFLTAIHDELDVQGY